MNNSQKIKFTGAQLHQGQLMIVQDILSTDAMFYTICTPRQFGKSFMAVQLMLYYALNFPNSKLMFTTPVYAQASKVFKELMQGIKDAGVIDRFNAAENSVIFINGSELFFKSIQQPDNLRGYSIDYLFLDEAAMYKDEIFSAVLRPMLTVRGKKCFLFSTPKGKNFFYSLYSKGLNSLDIRYRSYIGSSEFNPFANKEEIEDARKTLPESLFRQEYLAEFIDDGGEVFLNVNANSTIKAWEQPISSKIYYAGIDLGRQDDFTVLTIFDNLGNNVYTYRKNKVEWTSIITELAQILNIYKPRYTLVECNGIGDVVFSMLKQKFSNITPWITSNQSKQDIIEELILGFQDNEIKIATKSLFPELHLEISDFSFEYSRKTRKIMYAARNGHDDTIMSMAIANHARKTGVTKGIYAIR
jgi:phage FluMu gp28-like protein